MKTRLHTKLGRSSGFGVFLLSGMLMALGNPAAGADSLFSATGCVYQVPVPGIWVTNPVGQVQVKGNVHVIAMLSSDPRMTGRLQAGMDLAWQTNGIALGVGPAYLEVGTWLNQTNFTPTGGIWVMNYRGVVQPGGSEEMSITAYGTGGEIDGLRAEATAARGPGGLFDMRVPYVVSGVIKSAPVTITNTISFANAAKWLYPPPPGCSEVTSNQLTLRICSPTVSPNLSANWVLAGPGMRWSVTQGQTAETRVELVGVNDPSACAVVALWKDFGFGYGLYKGRDWVALGKYANSGMSIFQCKKVAPSDTPVVLALALTPAGASVSLTARVISAESGNVLRELAAPDTPASDPRLTAEEFYQTTGIQMGMMALDPPSSPWTSGIALSLMVMQSYTNAFLPAGEATFEALELRTYDIPPLGVNRAILVTVPCAEGMSYILESAPTLDGPWLPVNLQTSPGVQTFTIPAVKGGEFFRPLLAP